MTLLSRLLKSTPSLQSVHVPALMQPGTQRLPQKSRRRKARAKLMQVLARVEKAGGYNPYRDSSNGRFTSGERLHAVSGYTWGNPGGDGYADAFRLNDALRYGKTLSAKDARQVEVLDDLLSEQEPLSQPLVVYRAQMQVPLLGSNGTWQDKGFLSTSKSLEETSAFGEEGDGYTLEIQVPKGARVLQMDPELGDYDQQEVLFPRGSVFRVLRREGRHLTLRHHA